MGQSRIETILAEEVLESGFVQIKRRTIPTSFTIDEDFVHDHSKGSYPIRVALMGLGDAGMSHTLNGEASTQGSREIIGAKYLLGCDGAHSWVRTQLGLKLEGATRDVSWGVLDAFPITDFRASIVPFNFAQSLSSLSMLLIFII